MYYRFTEGDDVFGVERLGSNRDESIFAPTIERVVFPSPVDAYDRNALRQSSINRSVLNMAPPPQVCVS
jgi:hypothetical protein